MRPNTERFRIYMIVVMPLERYKMEMAHPFLAGASHELSISLIYRGRMAKLSHTLKPASTKHLIGNILVSTRFFRGPLFTLIKSKFGSDGIVNFLALQAELIESNGELSRMLAEGVLFGLGASQEVVNSFLEFCLSSDVGALYLKDKKIRCLKIDEELGNILDKRKYWRQYKQNQKVAEVSIENPQGFSKSSETETETEYETDLGSKSKKNSAPKILKIEIRPHVWFSEEETRKFLEKHDQELYDRCCDKLSAWIDQDPTPKRKRNGVNARATCDVWVKNAVQEDIRRSSQVNIGTKNGQNGYTTVQQRTAAYLEKMRREVAEEEAREK